ncbi:Exocyst complex component protein [Mycena chlorophos]|uniref:Exocyst complex component protein n=1 Tax=Mycena chlorophos TaxID=658473 RepID=A0A8H6S506_MYCCL|nr:Exocyst complex component protein [Mycena chlorophos]
MASRRAAPTLDPSVEEHLQLSAFKVPRFLPMTSSIYRAKAKFDVTEFVGNVSEKLIAQSKQNAGPFDPKPFIDTFEAAVDKLIAVRKDVQSKTEQMEKSVRISEREYSKKMADLNRGFETVGNSFSGMESRMNEVSSTAIRIGEQLETVAIERQRAQAAYDLIDFYNQFSRGDTTRLDALRKDGRAGRRQVAVLLRRLNTVAKEVDLPTADKTRENIEKYCEKFEKEMLGLFDRCYRRGDPKMMHHCAQTLLEFNGGASCVQVYVNQHDFFINSAREAKPKEDTLLWTVLPDPDASPPKTEIGLTELFTEIRATVDTEAQIVKAVFPNPPVVMQVFLQRVFAQSIQQHMEQLLHRAGGISDLAYLRVLQLVHIQATSLVDDLKTYELPSVAVRTSFEASEFRRSLTGSAMQSAGSTATVGSMLESAMDELFVTYTEAQRYLERETKSLGTLFGGLLANFARYHTRVQKAGKSSYFDLMKNQLSAAAATGASSTTSAQAAAVLMRFGGINATAKQDEEPLREEDGVLSIEVAETMLKWHAEAIGRCVELSPDVSKHTFALLRVLSDALAQGYVEAAIETANARVESGDGKSEPNLQPLTILRVVDLICHLWQQYVNTALLPLASSSVTIRREMTVYNNQTVSRVEGAANALTQRITDSIITWLSSLLAKQKKSDYKPRNDDLSFARVNTEPCTACCETLERVRDAAKLSLSGKNLEIFLTEIGVSFHRHKFPVSDAGGLMLAKDIKMYQDTISTFGIAALNERFEFIRQLGNIFLVRPDILKSYITENYLGRVDASLLKPYIALRSDYAQFEKSFADVNGAEDATAGRGFRDRFGRLSVMMKELEGIRNEGLKISEGISMPSIPTSLAGAGFGLSSGFAGISTRFG